MADRGSRLKVACWIFEGVSYLFWLTGLILSILNLTGTFPGHGWQGPLFIVIGTSALLTTKLGLSQYYQWAWLALAFLLVPWTLTGLVADMRMGYLPLAVGEMFGLAIIIIALFLAFPAVFFRKTEEEGHLPS